MADHQALLVLEAPSPARRETSTSTPVHSCGWGWAAARAAAALVFLLTTAGLYYLLVISKSPPASIVFSRVTTAHHRSLRGAGGIWPVTSPTNGGNVVAGVPWTPFSIAEAEAKYPPNAIRMAQNGLVGVSPLFAAGSKGW